MATINCEWGPPVGEEEAAYWEHAERLARTLPEEWVVTCRLAGSDLIPVIIEDHARIEVARCHLMDYATCFFDLAMFLERSVAEVEDQRADDAA